MGDADATVAEVSSHFGACGLKVATKRTQKKPCACCHKFFADSTALEAHWKLVQHSAHDAVCNACGRHFPSYDTLRQHLVGNLPKASCAEAYKRAGCERCYEIFQDDEATASHACIFRETEDADDDVDDWPCVALDCEFVGVGEAGEKHACARVCVVGSSGEILLHTWVNPGEEVTDYREELTGATPEKLADAPSLERVRAIVVQILLGKAVQTRREHVGVKHLLIGHSVEHDLEVLDIKWKKGMRRDTAQFPLYLRHTHLPFKLRALAEQFLGEKIQEEGEAHDPCVDARISMRLYQAAKRRDHGVAKRWFDITLKDHPVVVPDDATSDPNAGIELLRRTIDHDGAAHTTRFYCWCQDRGARSRAGPPSPPPAHRRRARKSAKPSSDTAATPSSSSSASPGP